MLVVFQGFKEYSKDLSMVFRGVSWEFRGSLEGVSIKSLGCFMGVSRMFKGFLHRRFKVQGCC